MGQWRLFEEGTTPEHSTELWYQGRDRAHHLEEEMHQPRLHATAELVRKSIDEGYGNSVVDLGCGDGGLLSLLGDDVTAWGYDLQSSNVEGGKERGVDVRLGNAVEGDVEWAPIVVATEFLEHLVEPHQMVRKIADNAQVLIASSPRTERPGSAYAFHTWCFSDEGYDAMLEDNGFRVVDHLDLGFFQVVRGIRK